MCGIAGCYQQADGRKLTDIMTVRIAHRGPDASGVWNHEDDRVSVQLGRRRLSIIDLSAAADQPPSKGPGLRIEPGALVASMLCCWVREQWRAIAGVRKLPGGSCARFSPDGRVHLEHYWQFADVAREAELHEIEISPDIVDLLPKASFSAPLRAWVRNGLQEVISDVLVRGELVGSGIIRAGSLDRLIHDERAGREDNAKQIWQLLSLELWYRNVRSMGVAA